jgi:hypothetical protein
MLVTVLLAACGPNPEEAKKAESERARAAAKQELMLFATKNSATAVDLNDLFLVRERFTAKLQEELEGHRIAFRSDSLVDVVRVSDSVWHLVLSDLGTTVVLETGRDDVEKLLHLEPYSVSLLIAAQVEKVVPLSLTLRSCPKEEDCYGVELEPNLAKTAYRVTGKTFSIQIEGGAH